VRRNKRDKKALPILLLSVLILAAVAGLSYLAFFFVRIPINNAAAVRDVQKLWSAHDYAQTYKACNEILSKQPFNNTALTLKGYSAFYLAVKETDTTQSHELLDTAIISMRVALQNATEKLLPQLYYMLGKAYFYKNTLSSYHYYADLVINYLTEAQNRQYKADDISLYLGLSYAALNMTMESISAFTEALLVRESDTLLMDIASQYYKAGQETVAKQYVYRVVTASEDEDLVNKGHMLLGQIYINEDNLAEARTEFETILKKNANSADAHYWLGVIYEKQGDLIKARAEWRTVLRIQVTHSGALQKMADYK
jgi:tetratricopeptide (TPR) repeat protein